MPPSESEELGLWVRPYVRSQGRTRPSQSLPVEALVSTQALEAELPTPLRLGDYRTIIRLCTRPCSVAEVAASLHLPLGTARVLLDDLAERGLITIHIANPVGGHRSSFELMQRVLHGLRRL